MKKCIVIYNPNSGKPTNHNFMNEFENILSKNDYDPTIIFTERKGHAKEIMINIDDADLVISVGGDGTFNETVTGNFEREKKLLLSHIPVGTTNDIGAMFGYGKNVIANLKALLNGVVRGIDICLINNHPFVYVAGFGKFMNIPYETPRDLKKKIGYVAYLLEGAKSFKHKTSLYDLTYTCNGETYRGLYSFMLISNANRIAGINNFYKDVKLDDNQFEVLFCNLTTKSDIIKSLYYLKTSDITKVPGFYFHKTDKLDIIFAEPPKKVWCVDGEALPDNTTNFQIRIFRNMKIMLPSKNINKLFEKDD
ncbi:MAG: YegS/Rv2252/BmrU family lipid kinase [Bacilli bacterium]|nr:YegS/Rv2252/BmrU family lipid kinase [Bacilli bacterium]MDD4809333.1 YegS/Rv2252/BmrU family lipid kinase [Bacilli bacterium]